MVGEERFLMRILNAIYLAENGTKTTIELRDVTFSLYEDKLKGNMFCHSENCPARISFSSGRKAHFRTWRMDKHANDCIYQFDRIPVLKGRSSTESINVEIPFSRRQNALQEAFRIMNLSDEEKEESLGRQSPLRPREKERAIAGTKRSATGIQMVLFEGEKYDEELIKRQSYILKRTVDEIKSQDIGTIRLIMGQVIGVKEEGQTAEITIENNDMKLSIVFEEAFTADRLNSSYLNKFWAIERLLNDSKIVLFAGIGDVRKKTDRSRIELVIYRGDDFRVNNKDMSVLAADYVRADL